MSARTDRWVFRHPGWTSALMLPIGITAGAVTNLFVRPPSFWSVWQLPSCVVVLVALSLFVDCVAAAEARHRRKVGL